MAKFINKIPKVWILMELGGFSKLLRTFLTRRTYMYYNSIEDSLNNDKAVLLFYMYYIILLVLLK